MAQKRLRIIAGPNGSGKSTFIKNFPSTTNLNLGIYINADDIEKELKETHFLSLSKFNLIFNTIDIQAYFKESTFSPIRLDNKDLWQNFSVEDNKIKINKKLTINSYIAADLAEFLRLQLLNKGISFSYETVMSDHKKIDFLLKAKENGYRIYLYYFSTEDPLININKVKIRVAQLGHPVDENVITSRYYRSLNNLLDAVKLSDRAYLFDSSGEISILFSEITNGKKVEIFDTKKVPNWFFNYLVEKK